MKIQIKNRETPKFVMLKKKNNFYNYTFKKFKPRRNILKELETLQSNDKINLLKSREKPEIPKNSYKYLKNDSVDKKYKK